MKHLAIIATLFISTFVYSNTEPLKITENKPKLSLDKKLLREAFIGEWESVQITVEGNTKHSSLTRAPDSRYVVEFKILSPENELIRSSKEFGYWGVSGDIYFTSFRGWIKGDKLKQADPTNAYYYDAYNILKVTESELIYENLSSGNKYKYTRVQ